MIIFSNVIFVLLSMMFMIGRLYEISAITDLQTNFLTANPVVTSPLMTGIACVVAVCCSVVIFAGNRTGKKIRSLPVGILGIMAGVFFVAGGIVNSVECFRYGGFILYHGMQILGGIGLILLGVMNIKGKKKEIVPVVFTLLIPIGVCMNSVLHEIKPIADGDFLYRSMAGIFTLIFLLFLIKAVYAYDKFTKSALYAASLLNFLFTGIGSLCAVIGRIITGTVYIPQLFYNVGFIFTGMYSLFIAFYILPSKTAKETVEKEEAYVPPVKKVKPVSEPQQYTPVENTEESYNFSATGNINQAAINELFAKKDKKETAVNPVDTYVPQSPAKDKTAEFKVDVKEYNKPTADDEKTAVIFSSKSKTTDKKSTDKATVKKTVYKAKK